MPDRFRGRTAKLFPVIMNMGRPAKIIGLLTAVIVLSTAGRCAAQGKVRTLELIQADSTLLRTTDAGIDYFSYGDVIYGIGEDRLYCDWAARLQSENRIICRGNVLLVQGDRTTYADSLVYDQGEQTLRAFTDVRMEQPGRYLLADSVVYHRDSQLGWAYGNALLVDSLEHTRIEGERMVFQREQNYAICDSLPRMILDFADSTGQTEILGGRLEYDRKTGRGIAKGNVFVRRGDWTATCGKAETWADSGIIIMTIDPVGRGVGAQTSGDSLILYSVNRQLERVRVINNAEAIYRPGADTRVAGAAKPDYVVPDTLAVDTLAAGISSVDSLSMNAVAPDRLVTEDVSYRGEQNQLWGNEITFLLADNRLLRIDAVGAARSTYLPAANQDTTAELRGENNISGDTLTIHLTDGQIDHAIVRGGGRGTYYNPVGRHTDAIDTIVYSSDVIEFLPDSSQLYLSGNGKLDYGAIVLTADQIRYNTKKKLLAAEGRPHPDSAGVWIGPPILEDGKQTVLGETLTYDVGTGRGRITGSFTEYDKAYYYGDDFYKYTDREFFVKNGVYTTCDRKDHPHYSFRGKMMKIIRDDKVIARPVRLYIDELPTLEIPYYVFPIKPGRHSGFLSMNIGNFEQGRRFVDNIGYYWAASQYWDLETAVNIREETGLQFRGTVRYGLRYVLSGSLTGTYAREERWNTSPAVPIRQKKTRWSLEGYHRHTVSPTLSISGSGSFVSDPDFYTDFSHDPEDRRNRSIRSQININKRWTGASLTMAVQNTDNLDADVVTRLLPSVAFSLFNRSLIPAPDGADAESRWYHSIRYSYSSGFSHNISQGSSGDKRYATLNQNISFSAPQKLFSYITVSPSLAAQETWYYVFATDRAEQDSVLINAPAGRASLTMSVSANSNLYGAVHPRLFGLETFRHTLSPRISYAFSPSVTAHDDLRAFTGKGGGSSRRSQSLSLSLGNNLDAKIIRGGKEKKLSLLSGSISTRYNFESDERKWSTLSSSLSTRLVQKVSFSVSATHDLYNPKTLDLQWTKPRLTSFSISTATSLVGGASALAPFSDWNTSDTISTEPGGLPFNASISYRYHESRSLNRITKSHWIGGSLQISPTPNWRVNFTTNYDLANHRTSDQEFVFSRDLHCWEGQFRWVPGGGRAGYYFKINVKALPDIKIEKSESGITGAVLN